MVAAILLHYVINDPYRLMATIAFVLVMNRLYLSSNAVSSACSSKCAAVCAIFFYLVCMVAS